MFLLPCYFYDMSLSFLSVFEQVKLSNGEEHFLVGSLDLNQCLWLLGEIIGKYFLEGIISQLRWGFKRNDKHVLLALAKFVACCVNQQVAHNVIGCLKLLIIY